MSKKCMLCDDGAEFGIKSSNDYYCKGCALDMFGETDCLVPLEEVNAPVEDAVDQFEEVKDVVEAQRNEEQLEDEERIEILMEEAE